MSLFTSLRLFSPQWKKITVTILIIISSGVSIFQLQQANIGKIRSERTERLYKREAQQTALNLNILRNIPSFGFDNLLADWTFLRFIQYQGNREARNVTGYSLNPKYFRAVVERDPRFLSAYFLLSPATTLFAASPEVSVELIEKGIKKVSPEKFPRAYYLWMYKGTDEVLFLGDISEAINSYQMAEKWASLHETEEAKRRAESAKEMIAFLKENPDSTEARIGAWSSVLSWATSQEARDLAIQRIRDLGGEVTVTSEGQLDIKLPEEQ